MQNIIVYIIVFLCVAYAGKHILGFFKKKSASKGNGCGCGCSGCQLSQKASSCKDKF